MDITTFGAVMKFALDRENELKEVLDRAAGNDGLLHLRDRIEALSKCGKKNIMFLERTRRENINEMVLEPISGLNAEDYLFDANSIEGMSPADVEAFLRTSAERMAKFYLDAAGKLPVDEVKRTFERLAKSRDNT